MFHNLLSQKTGMNEEELRYVIHDRVFPTVLPNVAAERTYQIRLYGEAFGEDNWTVFRMIKDYLINSPGWDWIERFNATENGYKSFWAW